MQYDILTYILFGFKGFRWMKVNPEKRYFYLRLSKDVTHEVRQLNNIVNDNSF